MVSFENTPGHPVLQSLSKKGCFSHQPGLSLGGPLIPLISSTVVVNHLNSENHVNIVNHVNSLNHVNIVYHVDSVNRDPTWLRNSELTQNF